MNVYSVFIVTTVSEFRSLFTQTLKKHLKSQCVSYKQEPWKSYVELT